MLYTCDCALVYPMKGADALCGRGQCMATEKRTCFRPLKGKAAPATAVEELREEVGQTKSNQAINLHKGNQVVQWHCCFQMQT